MNPPKFRKRLTRAAGRALFVAVLALLPNPALAEEEPVGSVSGTYHEANDAKEIPDDPGSNFANRGSVVKMEGASFLSANRIHQRDNKLSVVSNVHYHGITAFGAESTMMSADATWLRFTGFKAAGFIDHETFFWWKNSLSLGAGKLELDHFENVRYETQNLIPLWKVKSVFVLIPGSEFRIGGNNDFSCTGWCNRSGRGEVMTVNNFFAEAETDALNAWHLKSNARYSIMSDDNRQLAFDHSVMRDLVTGPFTLQMGVGGGWMGYREEAIYWSPEYFSEYGARLVAKKALSRRLYAELKARTGFHRTRGKAREDDFAVETMLRYAPNSKWRLELAGNVSTANKGAWWRRDLALKLEMRL